MYSDNNGVILKVRTFDQFQGDDGNDTGSIGGVLSCPKKTDFILTKACHCLWIVGSGSTLIKSGSIWEAVVRDAQERHCFFNADEDELLLSKSIVNVKEDLNQMDSLLHKDSVIYRTSRCTVLFSDKFKLKFTTIKSSYSKRELLFFLLKLAGGWLLINSITLLPANVQFR